VRFMALKQQADRIADRAFMLDRRMLTLFG
jgi:hypothetical protein